MVVAAGSVVGRTADANARAWGGDAFEDKGEAGAGIEAGARMAAEAKVEAEAGAGALIETEAEIGTEVHMETETGAEAEVAVDPVAQAEAVAAIHAEVIVDTVEAETAAETEAEVDALRALGGGAKECESRTAGVVVVDEPEQEWDGLFKGKADSVRINCSGTRTGNPSAPVTTVACEDARCVGFAVILVKHLSTSASYTRESLSGVRSRSLVRPRRQLWLDSIRALLGKSMSGVMTAGVGAGAEAEADAGAGAAAAAAGAVPVVVTGAGVLYDTSRDPPARWGQ